MQAYSHRLSGLLLEHQGLVARHSQISFAAMQSQSSHPLTSLLPPERWVMLASPLDFIIR